MINKLLTKLFSDRKAGKLVVELFIISCLLISGAIWTYFGAAIAFSIFLTIQIVMWLLMLLFIMRRRSGHIKANLLILVVASIIARDCVVLVYNLSDYYAQQALDIAIYGSRIVDFLILCLIWWVINAYISQKESN